jgi:hypothetical protein
MIDLPGQQDLPGAPFVCPLCGQVHQRVLPNHPLTHGDTVQLTERGAPTVASSPHD